MIWLGFQPINTRDPDIMMHGIGSILMELMGLKGCYCCHVISHMRRIPNPTNRAEILLLHHTFFFGLASFHDTAY